MNCFSRSAASGPANAVGDEGQFKAGPSKKVMDVNEGVRSGLAPSTKDFSGKKSNAPQKKLPATAKTVGGVEVKRSRVR
jgi:hypothetical protein